MGHASEADEIIKKRSFLSTVVGKKVASDLITMVDDGTVEGAYGSIPSTMRALLLLGRR